MSGIEMYVMHAMYIVVNKQEWSYEYATTNFHEQF